MWSEICELIPLTTGLDSCIEHDIQEYQTCIKVLIVIFVSQIILWTFGGL